MRSITLFFFIALAGCSASSHESAPPVSQPPQQQPQQQPPQPAPDVRCPAGQMWVDPPCGAHGDLEGCYTNCKRGGATPEQRMNQSACPSGFTCTRVMRAPGGFGAEEACAVEDFLCLRN